MQYHVDVGSKFHIQLWYYVMMTLWYDINVIHDDYTT